MNNTVCEAGISSTPLLRATVYQKDRDICDLTLYRPSGVYRSRFLVWEPKYLVVCIVQITDFRAYTSYSSAREETQEGMVRSHVLSRRTLWRFSPTLILWYERCTKCLLREIARLATVGGNRSFHFDVAVGRHLWHQRHGGSPSHD